MNMKKGDKVYVITPHHYNLFGYVEEVKEETVVVRVKITSCGHLLGDDGKGVVDTTPRIHEYKKSKVFPAKEYADKRMKVLAKWIHNMTEFL